MYNFTSKQHLNMKNFVLALSWNYNGVPVGIKRALWVPRYLNWKEKNIQVLHIQMSDKSYSLWFLVKTLKSYIYRIIILHLHIKS